MSYFVGNQVRYYIKDYLKQTNQKNKIKHISNILDSLDEATNEDEIYQNLIQIN